MLERKRVAVMTEAQFSATITAKGEADTYPLLAKSNVTNTERTMQMAPIPPHFVYDGFENDLDAALILERIMGISSTTSNMFTHLQYVFGACLTSHNAGDNKPYVGSNELTEAPSMAAWQWGKEKNPNVFRTYLNKRHQSQLVVLSFKDQIFWPS